MIRISPLLFFISIFLCFLGFRTCFLVFVHSGISFFGFLFICTSDRSDYYCVHPFIANYSSQNTVIVFEIIDKKINLLLLFFSLPICQTPALLLLPLSLAPEIFPTGRGSPFMGKHFRCKMYTNERRSFEVAIVKKAKMWP